MLQSIQPGAHVKDEAGTACGYQEAVAWLQLKSARQQSPLQRVPHVVPGCPWLHCAADFVLHDRLLEYVKAAVHVGKLHEHHAVVAYWDPPEHLAVELENEEPNAYVAHACYTMLAPGTWQHQRPFWLSVTVGLHGESDL